MQRIIIVTLFIREINIIKIVKIIEKVSLALQDAVLAIEFFK